MVGGKSSALTADVELKKEASFSSTVDRASCLVFATRFFIEKFFLLIDRKVVLRTACVGCTDVVVR